MKKGIIFLFPFVSFLAVLVVLSFAACKMEGNPTKSFATPNRYQASPYWVNPGENTVKVDLSEGSADISRSTGKGDKYLYVVYSERVASNKSQYVIYLGEVNNVPIVSAIPGQYRGVTPITLTHISKTINSTTVENSLKTAVTETTVKGNVKTATAQVNLHVGEAGLGAAAEFKITDTTTNQTTKVVSTEETYTTAQTKAEEVSNSASITVGEHGEPVGRYRLTMFATTDVFLVVYLNDAKNVVGEPEFMVCARPASYTYGIDYDVNLDGDFLKDSGKDMLPHPDYLDYASLSFVEKPTRFVIAGRDGLTTYSDDGINWKTPFVLGTRQTASGSTNDWNAVAYADDQWVAVGYNDATAPRDTVGKVAWSTDGISWTSSTLGSAGTGASATAASYALGTKWNTAAYHDNTWIAVGVKKTENRTGSQAGTTYKTTVNYQYTRSTDGGKTWSTPANIRTDANVPTSVANTTADMNGIAYGNGRWVAVGTDIAAYSTNGTAWTVVSIAAGNWKSVAYAGGKFVAVGSTGVAQSVDGTSWAPMALGANNWNSVCYGDGLFVAVADASGGFNRTAYSTDGFNWTTTNAAGSANWLGVSHAAGNFVAAGSGGKIAVSADGKTWTEKVVAANSTDIWRAVAGGSYYR